MSKRYRTFKRRVLRSPIAFGSIAVIIVCAALIVVSFIWSREVSIDRIASEHADNSIVPAVKEDDHIRGNASSAVILYVYTDTECPYCKNLHEYTIPRLEREYGSNIAVVYRHNPLDTIHPLARHEHEALECAYNQGGDPAFWHFIDRIFTLTKSNETFPPAELENIALQYGLDSKKFHACIEDKSTSTRVSRDSRDAALASIDVTPSTVVAGKGRSILVSGNYYSQLRAAIEVILRSSATP